MADHDSAGRTAAPPISVQQVAMPQGGGGVQGMGEHFQANAFSGEFSFGVPVPCSPCREFEPELKLAYSSMAGNGAFGLGFRVALSSVTRQTSLRIPRYDEDDVFLLDGDQLVPVLGGTSVRIIGGTSYSVTAYRPRTEVTFDRIERWRAPGEDFWRVIDRSGVLSRYGRTPAARVADPRAPARIAEWLIEYSIHPRGDVRAFSYKAEDAAGVPATAGEAARSHTAGRHPERIRYGNVSPYAATDGGIGPVPEQHWHFEVVFDYGEYDIDPGNDDPYAPVRPWPARTDPFSGYRYGFELRTHRLCRNVLMFHRFTGELGPDPVLVHALSLAYNEDPAGTTLTQCRLTGYRHYPGQPTRQRYRTRAVPPLTLSYSPFEPGASLAARPLTDVDGLPVEGFTARSGWAVADLYRDGVPGLLYADGQSAYYRRPVLIQTAGTDVFSWSAREPLPGFPVQRAVDGGGITLSDLDGDGLLELVSVTDETNGFYPARAGGGWGPYTPFAAAFPGLPDAGYDRADLVGDGRQDIVWREPGAIGWFASRGEEGFDAARITLADPALPPALGGSGGATEQIMFADPLGGGTPSLVRIADGAVECWPSLGYGRFGPAVALDNVPVIGEQYDARRVRLADLDGSGTPALVYAHAGRLDVYRNLSGNGFASEPLRVPLPAPCTRPEQLLFADLTGSGYECAVFSTDDPAPQAWAIDLCGGLKPHLVVASDNGQGAGHRVAYRGCARDRLLDARDGTPWITSIPFPLAVVAEVITTDQPSQVATPVTFRYHHGHYDHVEREFRGFGMVEQTEGRDGALLTRTWYHTGAWLEAERLEAAYRREYFAGDPHSWPPCAVVYDLSDGAGTAASPAAAREAAVALSGEILREERYGLDGSAAATVPFDVAEHGYRVRLLQPPSSGASGGAHGVYTVHERENIEANYERHADDPLVHQHFVLGVDDWGDVLLECAVACARRPGAPDPAAGQDAARALAMRRGWHAITGKPDAWLLGQPAEQRSWEIADLAAADVDGLYYSFAAVDEQVRAAIAGAPGAPAAVLAQAFAYRYAGDPITPQALLIAREEAFVQDAVLRAEFAGQPAAPSLGDLLSETGGYRLDADGLWWNPSAREAYHPLDGFYQPASTSDPLAAGGAGVPGTIVSYGYDPHWLLLVSATMSSSAGDVLPHAVTATQTDYIALAACQIRDENGGLHEGLRDPLGVVTALSSYGHEWHDGAPRAVGFAPLDFDQPPRTASSLDQLLSDPSAYLAGASCIWFYDQDTWRTGGTPTVLAHVTAASYPATDGRTAAPPEIRLTYHDGSQRELQETSLAEPAPDTTDRANTADMADTAAPAPVRWRTGASFGYDDRGRPVRAWRPSFASSPAFVAAADRPDAGLASTASYDALDRMVRAGYAEGALTEAFFATWQYGPWSVTSADRDDTVKESACYQRYVRDGDPGLSQWDLDALRKAADADGTPATAVSDNLGNRCELRTLLAPGARPLIERAGFDILGRELWAADPRLSAAGARNIERQYTLAGDAMRVDSVDAGSRWILRNAVGKVIYQYDSRGFAVVTRYDGLHRVTAVSVSGGDAGDPPAVTELHIYGDSIDGQGGTPVPDPAARNLIGREWHRYDDSGLREQSSFTLTAQPLATATQSRVGYRRQGDWPLPAAPCWTARVAALAAALDGEVQSRSLSYDALGRPVATTDPAGHTTALTRHVSGLVDTLTWTPAGGQARRYVVRTEYGADEQPTATVYGDGAGRPVVTTRRAYDPRNGRPRSLTVSLIDGTLLQELTYYLDPVGNVTHVGQAGSAPPAAPDGDRDHAFDPLYRLVESHGRVVAGYTASGEQDPGYDPFFRPGLPAAEPYTGRFSYDDGGNLTVLRYETPGGGWGHRLVVAAGSNRAVPVADATSPPAGGHPGGGHPGDPEPAAGLFDACGNLLALDGLALDWSFAGRLRRAGGNGQAKYSLYDVDGQRTATIVERGPTVTRVLYLGDLERHRVSVDGKTQEEYDCVRLGLDEGTTAGFELRWRTGAPPPGVATSWFQFTDLLGSAVLEIDDSGRPRHGEEYLPYGGTALAYAAAGAAGAAGLALKPWRYAGQERDPVSGLYCYGLRSYACWLGRWVSPDPVLDADGLNLYAYAHDNPVTATDVLGLAVVKGGAKKAKKAKIQNVTHHKEPINSSKFRFFRRMQYAFGGTRNIGMKKLRRASGNGPRVLYLLARSMGLSVRKMTLLHEEVATKAGTPKHRGHSEAVLRAVDEVGIIKAGKHTINLSDYTVEYAASTNQACGVQHENCHDQSVPFLGAADFYHAVAYTGTATAHDYEKSNNYHQKMVGVGGYASGDESEDDYMTLEVTTEQFRGYDRGNVIDPQTGQLTPMTAVAARTLTESMAEGKKPRKNVYDEKARRLKLTW